MTDFLNGIEYHPRRKDREINDPSKLQEILKTGKYIIIAMCHHDEPYIVTLSYGFDESNNALYLHCTGEGQKLDFIHNNPGVCATIILDKGYAAGECKQHYTSIVLRGKMAVVQEHAEKIHGFEILIKHLEGNSGTFLEKLTTSYAKRVEETTILRLDIADIKGKEGS